MTSHLQANGYFHLENFKFQPEHDFALILVRAELDRFIVF